MKNSHKKFLAFSLATVLAFGGSFTAFAAEQDTTAGTEKVVKGDATFDYINKEVYKLTIPTDDRLEQIFDYYVDPQGLIKETLAKKVVSPAGLEADKISDSKVLFANKGDDATSGSAVTAMTETSDKMILTNKGSVGVDLKIQVLFEGSGTYDGGYSTTQDFSGTEDETKGLYFGLISTAERTLPITGTGFTVTNGAISAEDKYETTVSGGAYTYSLKSDAADFPTYEFQVTAALNNDVPEDYWTTRSGANGDTLTNKSFNPIKIKFTPYAVRGVIRADSVFEGDDIYISKAGATESDGGFGTGKPALVVINGKDVPSANIEDNADGYVHISWAEVCAAWGYDASNIDELYTEDEVNEIYSAAKTVVFKMTDTATAGAYYVDVPARD